AERAIDAGHVAALFPHLWHAVVFFAFEDGDGPAKPVLDIALKAVVVRVFVAGLAADQDGVRRIAQDKPRSNSAGGSCGKPDERAHHTSPRMISRRRSMSASRAMSRSCTWSSLTSSS